MQDVKAVGYRISELADFSDDELYRIIRSSWGYQDSHNFEVIGQLVEIPRKSGGSFYILDQLHSVNDGSALMYPLTEPDVKHTVYIGAIKNTVALQDGQWVKTRLELSSKEERTKLKNPFALKSVFSSLQQLHALPEDIGNSDIYIDNQRQIEQWVVDFYRDNNRKQISEEREQLVTEMAQQRAEFSREAETTQQKIHKQRERGDQQLVELRNKSVQLNEELEKQAHIVRKSDEELASIRILKDKTEVEFNQRKNIMEYQLSSLNSFIEQKAKMLLDLDLIAKADVDVLLGEDDVDLRKEAHDFNEAFSSDPKEAVSYVHSYLQKKGIIYHRAVLEDFFALIKMNDLIILAGDSGSGKTNLVKSFAEAIGGKSVIVPVKPNWTSAEDLLGYYNPLQQKYLSTPFLDALFDAARHPETLYLICLDEMNLARVEYYFADFLSLMEERVAEPMIHLYSDSESEHMISEIRNFLSLIDEVKIKANNTDAKSFLDLMRDETLNSKLHEICGFKEGDSLLKYHAQLRKQLNSYLNTPSSIQLPANVRIIGAINVDETTHYLSPKILDRAHIMRFGSPLLIDWEKAEADVREFDLDMNLPVRINAGSFGSRTPYPKFDRDDTLVATLLKLVREYLEPLGMEFGLRTIRQARSYSESLRLFGASDVLILNNIILHKILPKLMFSGESVVDGSIARKDILVGMRDYLDQELQDLEIEPAYSCISELDRVIRISKSNDWVVNYWTR